MPRGLNVALVKLAFHLCFEPSLHTWKGMREEHHWPFHTQLGLSINQSTHRGNRNDSCEVKDPGQA